MTARLRTYLALDQTPLDGPENVAAWEEITDYVGEIHLQRGRQSERSAMEAGILTLVLDDEEGRFDPEDSPFSPYADVGACVKIELDVDSVITPVCVMYADEAPPSPSAKGRLATWQFSDGSALLEGASFASTYSAAEQATGAAIADCLGSDGLAWTGSTDIATGTVDVQAVSAGEIQGIGERLNTVQDIEFGTFFWARDGEPTFRDRNTRLAVLGTSLATFSDDPDVAAGEIGYADLQLSRARSAIENDWRITPTSSTEQAYEDAASITRYGRRTISKQQPFAEDADALVYCEHRVAERKDPRTLVSSLTCALVSDEDFTTCLGLELGDLTTYDHRGTEELMILEGISLDQVGGTTTFAPKLSPADTVAYWLLEFSGFSKLEQTTHLY